MLRTEKLLLDVDLFPTSIISDLNLNIDHGGLRLIDIMGHIEHAAKRVKDVITTASGKSMIVHSIQTFNSLAEVVDVITEGKTKVHVARSDVQFYAYGCPMLDFIKLVSIKLSMDNSSSKYQRDRLESQILSMADLPVLISMIPSEVIFLDNSTLKVASASSISGVLSFYKGVSLSASDVENGLFDSILLASISNGLNVNSDTGSLLLQGLRDTPDDVDLTTLFFPSGVKWIKIDPEDYYTIDFSNEQRIELLKAKDIGLTLATMCHRIISSGDVYDRKSHLAKIGDYLNAYHNLLDFSPQSNWLGEQLDVNVGYTAANALVPVSSQIASFASFVNSFEELITFGHMLKVSSAVDDITQLKWVNHFQQPINLVNAIVDSSVTVTASPDNYVEISSVNNEFGNIRFTSDRKTVLSAIKEMVDRNEGFIVHYYNQLMAMIDLIINVSAGGKVEINLSQQSYSVKSSPYLIKRILYPWIYTKSAKIKRK